MLSTIRGLAVIRMSEKAVLFPNIAILAAGLVIASAAGLFLTDISPIFGVRLLFDGYDLTDYFDSSRWVIEGGRLYREVPSEYPLLANMIFAVCRYLSNLISSGHHAFFALWIASACFIYYLCMVYTARGTATLVLLAWLAPAPIYFALYRYDLYPALATLISLFAIRREAYIEAALWLGIASALKGYALFLLPAYCVFIIYQRGFATAIIAGTLIVTPMILSLLATFAFAGWEGVIAPFEFHLVRTLNGETTYDAVNYLYNGPIIWINKAPWIAHSLQIAVALSAAAARPRQFEDLINSFLLAVLGFMSFSVFYSPQYVLWVLPFVYFSTSRAMLITTVSFSWLTYLCFPISFDLHHARPVVPAVIMISLLRLIMIFLAARLLVDREREAPRLKVA